MADVLPDWKRANDEHLRTYKGVMRLTLWSTIVIAVTLLLMAIFLV